MSCVKFQINCSQKTGIMMCLGFTEYNGLVMAPCLIEQTSTTPVACPLVQSLGVSAAVAAVERLLDTGQCPSQWPSSSMASPRLVLNSPSIAIIPVPILKGIIILAWVHSPSFSKPSYEALGNSVRLDHSNTFFQFRFYVMACRKSTGSLIHRLGCVGQLDDHLMITDDKSSSLDDLILINRDRSVGKSKLTMWADAVKSHPFQKLP